jgi:hypothetical protein
VLYRTRYVLQLIMSCWRWGLENSADFPEFCRQCSQRFDSDHTMFHCVMTENVRNSYFVSTGTHFSHDSFSDNQCSSEVATACESICRIIRNVAS